MDIILKKKLKSKFPDTNFIVKIKSPYVYIYHDNPKNKSNNSFILDVYEIFKNCNYYNDLNELIVSFNILIFNS